MSLIHSVFIRALTVRLFELFSNLASLSNTIEIGTFQEFQAQKFKRIENQIAVLCVLLRTDNPTTRMNEQTIEWFECPSAPLEALRLYGFRCSSNPGIHDFKKTRQKQGCAIPNGIYCTTTKPATQTCFSRLYKTCLN